MAISLTRAIFKSNFWIKLTNWEYWPFELVYTPIFFYWLWLAFRARSFFFFTSSNPGIENGGMLGESKWAIHKMLPENMVAKTTLVPSHEGEQFVRSEMRRLGLTFPIILKPDIGERGWRVEKILNDEGLAKYMASNQVDVLLQEYIDLPMELGVFYFCFPGKTKGQVTSVVKKKMLSVVGNGTNTVEELMSGQPRAKLQLGVFRRDHQDILGYIPEKEETIEIMPIGNHCKGTMFLDYNVVINSELNRVFDKLNEKIVGFNFGRFDIRCSSDEELQQGSFKIMELNGAGSEPSHIYQPGASLWNAYKSLFFHWKVLFRISRANKKRGTPYLTTRQGMAAIGKLRAYGRIKAAMA